MRTVGASVGHGEGASTHVLQLEVLIGKLGTVDRLATAAIAPGEVATLTHEVGDDPVEHAALVVEGLARGTLALLSCTAATTKRDTHGRSSNEIDAISVVRLVVLPRTRAEGAEVVGGLGDHVGEELRHWNDQEAKEKKMYKSRSPHAGDTNTK